MKRLFAILIITAMVINVMPLTVFADNGRAISGRVSYVDNIINQSGEPVSKQNLAETISSKIIAELSNISEGNTTFVVAFYDENNTLIKILVNDADLYNDYYNEILLNLDNIGINAKYYKLFIFEDITELKPVSKVKYIVPLIVDNVAELSWTSSYLPSSMKSKCCEFVVSGVAGSNTLYVSSANEVQLSEIESDEWWGAVLTENGTSGYVAYNARYKTDTELEIYPALKTDITDGVLANYIYDAGTDYAGMHLTKRGYMAYVQYTYNANPKHAEKTAYIAKWVAEDSVSELGPFVTYGGKHSVGVREANIDERFLNVLARTAMRFGYVGGWGDKYAHETKTGVKWENINLKNKKGYMELFLGGYVDGYDFPEGYEINIDLYLDGELKYHYVKANAILERLCVDFENATTATLDIYFNKMKAINSNSMGFTISRCTFWENRQMFSNYLIEPDKLIVQNFDSWGDFWNNIVADEFSSLHNEASGKEVAYINNSKGRMTSIWMKDNFESNVTQYNPDYVLLNFAINDHNSKEVTPELYSENMQWAFNECIKNNIQPILIIPTMHSRYSRYIWNMIDSIATLAE